ncbi:hypothetical protein KM043_015563 [Ampulex compressa]|nr:hypothetical protein KM043_015563 [Ampulex compressa]
MESEQRTNTIGNSGQFVTISKYHDCPVERHFSQIPTTAQPSNTIGEQVIRSNMTGIRTHQNVVDLEQKLCSWTTVAHSSGRDRVSISFARSRGRTSTFFTRNHQSSRRALCIAEDGRGGGRVSRIVLQSHESRSEDRLAQTRPRNDDSPSSRPRREFRDEPTTTRITNEHRVSPSGVPVLPRTGPRGIHKNPGLLTNTRVYRDLRPD